MKGCMASGVLGSEGVAAASGTSGALDVKSGVASVISSAITSYRHGLSISLVPEEKIKAHWWKL